MSLRDGDLTPLERILKERERRLGAGEEAERTSENRPRFLEVAKTRAERLGLGVEEMLAKDLQRMSQSRYPGPDCLQPSEVEDFVATGVLPPARRTHADQCPGCSELLAAAIPRLDLPTEEATPAWSWKGSRHSSSTWDWLAERSVRPWGTFAAAAASVFLALVASWLFSGGQIPVEGPASLAGAASIAVLPASDLHPGMGDVAIACTEMMRSALTADRDIPVVPSETSTELGLVVGATDLDRLTAGDLARVKRALGADSFVRCSAGAAPGRPGSEKTLHLEVQLITANGSILKQSFEVPADKADVPGLTLRAGGWVRKTLGLDELSEERREALRAGLPANAIAVRQHAQGVANLQSFRPGEAARMLSSAVAQEPHPMTLFALSEAWSQLGYGSNERQTADQAFQLGNRSLLPKLERLALTGRRSEALAQWHEAVEVYTLLEALSPYRAGYGIRVAQAYLATSDASLALAKVEELRRSGVSAGDAARLDLVEADAAEVLSDFRRQQNAALRAIDQGRELRALSVEAQGHLLAGRAARELGEYEQAGEHFDLARRRFAEIGDRNGVAGVQREQGVLLSHGNQRQKESARATFADALAAYRALGNLGGVATVEIDLGHMAADSRPHEAMVHYERALQLFRRIGHRKGQARALLSRGIQRALAADWSGADRDYEAALALFRQISDQSGQIRVLANLGLLQFEQGRLAEARESIDEVLSIREKLGLRRGVAWAHTQMAEILTYQGELAAAEEHCEAALEIYEDIEKDTSAESGRSVEATRVRVRQADLWIERGRAPEAEQVVREVLGELADREAAEASAVLARALLAQGRVVEAREALAGLDPGGRLGDELTLLTARLDAASNQPQRAIASLEGLAQRARRERLVLIELEARLVLGQIEIGAGRVEAGRSRLATVAEDARAIGAGLLVRKAEEAEGRKLALSSMLSQLGARLQSFF